jgi:hypothetical protein
MASPTGPEIEQRLADLRRQVAVQLEAAAARVVDDPPALDLLAENPPNGLLNLFSAPAIFR